MYIFFIKHQNSILFASLTNKINQKDYVFVIPKIVDSLNIFVIFDIRKSREIFPNK